MLRGCSPWYFFKVGRSVRGARDYGCEVLSGGGYVGEAALFVVVVYSLGFTNGSIFYFIFYFLFYLTRKGFSG